MGKKKKVKSRFVVYANHEIIESKTLMVKKGEDWFQREDNFWFHIFDDRTTPLIGEFKDGEFDGYWCEGKSYIFTDFIPIKHMYFI
jgi:hypothetical protein